MHVNSSLISATIVIEYVCHGVAGRLGHALDVQRVQQRCCEVQPDHCYQAIVIVAVQTNTVLECLT